MAPRARRRACRPAAAALYLSLSRGSLLAATIGVVLLAVTTAGTAALSRVALVALPAGGAFLLAAQVGRFEAPGASLGEIASLLALGSLALAAAILAVATPPVPVPQVSRSAGLAARGGRCRPGRRGARVPGSARDPGGSLHSCGATGRAGQAALGVDELPHRLLGRRRRDGPKRAAAREGAGGFTRIWLRERPALLFVKDAHNLYLETLAELGPVGLAALLLVLLTPLAGARRAARRPAGRAALAAYVALLAHAAVDWDWELPAVTLATVLLGVALVQLGGQGATRPLTPAVRGTILAAAALTGVVAIVAHAGNGSTAEAHDALDRGDASTAMREPSAPAGSCRGRPSPGSSSARPSSQQAGSSPDGGICDARRGRIPVPGAPGSLWRRPVGAWSASAPSERARALNPPRAGARNARCGCAEP